MKYSNIGMLCLSLFCATTASTQQPMNFKQLEAYKGAYREKMFASTDGLWFAFGEKTYLSTEITSSVIVKTIGNEKQYLIKGLDIGSVLGFTSNGKYFVYPDSADQKRYQVLELASGIKYSLDDIRNSFLIKGNSGDAILCHNTGGELFLYFAHNQRRKLLAKGVTSFKADRDGNTILIVSQTNDGKDAWGLLDLSNEKISLVVTGGKYENAVWSADGQQLAFLERQNIASVVWLYNRKTGAKRALLSDQDTRRTENREIAALGAFKAGGKSLELSLQELPKAQAALHPPDAKVTIWSYVDAQLHPNKPQDPMAVRRNVRALLLIGAGKLVDLEKQCSELRDAVGDWYYGLDSTQHFLLISAINNSKIPLTAMPADPKIFINTVSQDGNYLLYYYKNHWYGYDISEQKTACLTSGTNAVWHELTPLLSEKGAYGAADGFPVPIGGSLFRVGDQYDRWILDASGKKAPVCLTGGFGRKNRIELKEIENGQSRMLFGQKLLLSAVGELDRKRGFFTCSSSVTGELEQLVYTEAKFSELHLSEDGKRLFGVRETSQEAPNWYTSVDGKGWMQLSNVQPWYEGLKTQILVGKKVNGMEVRATLYTPRQFDPSRKYPVILNYYEQRSHDNHNFLRPALVAHNIDIPWFVDHGYLVLTPDIYYKQGYTGQSALDCINAAVGELVKLPYVDSAKMGIQGHSFGGFETFYLVAHSTRFKAALAGAGFSDLVSAYNTISKSMMADQNLLWVEKGILRMGATLWDRPDFFLANSPVLEADKVQTPLLIMHNLGDALVQYSQGMEFFMAMHRLGKPCWMLEYEGEKHSVLKQENQKDYMIRMMQFFDHYLKGGQAPLWMIEGMKYRDPKYTPGYELDTLGRKPGPGINSSEEQKKIDEYSKVPLVEKLKPLFKNKQE